MDKWTYMTIDIGDLRGIVIRSNILRASDLLNFEHDTPFVKKITDLRNTKDLLYEQNDWDIWIELEKNKPFNFGTLKFYFVSHLLDYLGQQGWELVFAPAENLGKYIFKRKLNSPE